MYLECKSSIRLIDSSPVVHFNICEANYATLLFRLADTRELHLNEMQREIQIVAKIYVLTGQ